MALTATAIQKAKSKLKPYKMADEKGLFAIVTPSGSKWWRLKYRFAGKEKMLALGTYPDTSLADAREKRDVARKQLAFGVDPGEAKKAAKLAQAGAESFEAIAREWLAQTNAKRTLNTNKTIKVRLEADLLPWLGTRPPKEHRGHKGNSRSLRAAAHRDEL